LEKTTEQQGVEMIERKVYRVNKSGMIAVMIPGKIAESMGISDITKVCIREMAPGMFKVWAPEVVDKTQNTGDNVE